MYGIGTHGISLVRVIWGFQRSTIEVVDLEKKLESPDPGSLSLPLSHACVAVVFVFCYACVSCFTRMQDPLQCLPLSGRVTNTPKGPYIPHYGVRIKKLWPFGD